MNPETLKRRWQEEDEQAISAAIDALTKHEHGRKLLWWLLQIGRVGEQPFNGNALQTSFACGELNVGQRILDRVTFVSPEGYLTMMKESADERNRRDTELRACYSGTDSGGGTEPDHDAG